MSLASRAFVEFSLAAAKKRIEDNILQVAREGSRTLKIACLPCHNEHIKSLIDWMKEEGLQVEYKTWMAKSTHFQAQVDDEETEHSQYEISF